MKLKFLIDSTKRDLRLIEKQRSLDGTPLVRLEDVLTVLNRWAKALRDENALRENEQRFQDILHKPGRMTMEEYREALDLLMFIHKPLIKGQNDVMGVRLQDADYIRLSNRLLGLPIESGVAEYNEKIEAMEAEERKKKAAEKAKRDAERKAQEWLNGDGPKP